GAPGIGVSAAGGSRGDSCTAHHAVADGRCRPTAAGSGQAAALEEGLDPRITPTQLPEGRHRVAATAPGEHRRPEPVAVLPCEPPVLVEPVDGVGIEHLAPDVGVVPGAVSAPEDVGEVARPVPGADQRELDTPGRE